MAGVRVRVGTAVLHDCRKAWAVLFYVNKKVGGKVFRISTVCYKWPMSAHASQAFSIAHCTDSKDLPLSVTLTLTLVLTLMRSPTCSDFTVW